MLVIATGLGTAARQKEKAQASQHCLMEDMGYSAVELKRCMLDRQMWRAFSENRLRST